MEAIIRLEAQIPIPGGEGNFVESSDPSSSNILHELFLLPKGLYSKIDSLMRKFWWGHKHKEKTIHWMKLEKMGLPKTQGGLGFRDFHCFNKGLLAKQIWLLWKNLDSLIARIMKAKYHPNDSVFKATLGKKKPSFAWRSMQGSIGLIQKGLIWRIGNGKKVRVWEDRWIPSSSTLRYNPHLQFWTEWHL
jgi:hypothetical protein